MVAMCRSCFEIYSDIGFKTCSNCASKTINVSVELVDVVKMFINRGFKVFCANCDTYKSQDGNGNITQIYIFFKAEYPQTIFDELPPDWVITYSYPVVDNQILKEPFTVLSCVCEHPPCECDPESIEFDKKITISNLETWLEDKDPEACKAILMLAGCSVDK